MSAPIDTRATRRPMRGLPTSASATASQPSRRVRGMPPALPTRRDTTRDGGSGGSSHWWSAVKSTREKSNTDQYDCDLSDNPGSKSLLGQNGSR